MIERINPGAIFTRLTVQKRVPPYKNPGGGNKVMWRCLCVCGRLTDVNAQHLRSGRIRSCGCLRKELAAKQSFVHGGRDTLLYDVWTQMIQRCENKRNKSFKNYGGRGIRVSAEWHDFSKFKRDMSPTYQPGLTIEREKNNGHYERGNCCWATNQRNCRNQRKTVRVRWEGKTVALIDLADRFAIKPATLYRRVVIAGWSLERALNQPTRSTQT